MSPAIIKPKFDKQSNMAIKRPAKIYDLQPSAIAGGYVYAVCHIHVIELDKIGDYGDAAVLPIELYVNHIEEKPTM